MSELRSLAIAGCLGAATVLAQSPVDELQAPWKSLTVLEKGDLKVCLEYLPEASVADEEWLRWVFVNRGEQDVEVHGMSFRSTTTCAHPETGAAILEGSGPSGDGAEMYPMSRFKTFIPPGTFRYGKSISRRAAALLVLTPKHGLAVTFRVHVDLELGEGEHLRTPAEGVPLLVQWRLPDAAGMKLAHARLRHLLANPERYPRFAYIAGLISLFEIEWLDPELSLSELAAALELREGAASGNRAVIAKHMLRLGYPSEKLTRFFGRGWQRRLGWSPDLHVVRSDDWNAALLPALLRDYEVRPSLASLSQLNRHREKWGSDREVTSRLFRATYAHVREWLDVDFSKVPVTKRTDNPPAATAKLRSWVAGARMLAKTRDPAVLATLRPFLKTRINAYWNSDVRMVMSMHGPPPAYRICDVALELMLIAKYGDLVSGLKVLGKSTDGTLKTASPAARLASSRFEWRVQGEPAPARWAGTIDEARDELIAELLKLTAK